jgi:hypothetical protein
MRQSDERPDRGKEALSQVYLDGVADRFLEERSGLGRDLARFGLESGRVAQILRSRG